MCISKYIISRLPWPLAVAPIALSLSFGFLFVVVIVDGVLDGVVVVIVVFRSSSSIPFPFFPPVDGFSRFSLAGFAFLISLGFSENIKSSQITWEVCNTTQRHPNRWISLLAVHIQCVGTSAWETHKRCTPMSRRNTKWKSINRHIYSRKYEKPESKSRFVQ